MAMPTDRGFRPTGDTAVGLRLAVFAAGHSGTAHGADAFPLTSALRNGVCAGVGEQRRMGYSSP